MFKRVKDMVITQHIQTLQNIRFKKLWVWFASKPLNLSIYEHDEVSNQIFFGSAMHWGKIYLSLTN
jgi:hypothetical protein